MLSRISIWISIAAGVVAILAFLTGTPSLPSWFRSDSRMVVVPSKDDRVTAVTAAMKDPMTFVAWLEGLANPNFTDLQRSEYVRQHEGREVTWTGYVRAVPTASVDGRLQLIIEPENSPGAGEVRFPSSFALALLQPAHRMDVLALKHGDFVTVQGTLATGRSPGTPALLDARLIVSGKN